jgi:hypothetical protein
MKIAPVAAVLLASAGAQAARPMRCTMPASPGSSIVIGIGSGLVASGIVVLAQTLVSYSVATSDIADAPGLGFSSYATPLAAALLGAIVVGAGLGSRSAGAEIECWDTGPRVIHAPEERRAGPRRDTPPSPTFELPPIPQE